MLYVLYVHIICVCVCVCRLRNVCYCCYMTYIIIVPIIHSFIQYDDNCSLLVWFAYVICM
jgi:hypothetical protein